MAKRVRPARHWQSKDAPLRVMAENAKPRIKRDIKAALKHLGTLLPANADHWARAGDWYGLRREIHWNQFRQVLKAPFATIGGVRHAAAQLGVKQINKTFADARRKVRFRKQVESHPQAVLEAMAEVIALEKDVGDQFNFDLYDQATQDRLRAAQDDLISQLETSARDTIENIVLAGAQAGLSPEDIVGDIRELIGLTDRQAQAVMNYENLLRTLDTDALNRQLRNTTMDEAVRAAIDSGQDLSEDQIEALVDDYTNNYLDYRAETIAQTESTRAVNAGLQDAYQQAIDRGVFPADAVRQHWTVALDERTCEICLSIPDMNEDGVAIGDPFDSVDGPQDAPPDPHPNCRCSLEIVTDLDKVPD